MRLTMSLRQWLASGAISLVSSGLLAAPVAPLKYRTMAVDTLRELVEIDSVEPHGSRECVNAIANRLRTAGFTDRELTILAPEEHPEKANLVVRLRGKGVGKPLLWTGHLDVVEADPNDWSMPPFKLSESDGWYYGRGTADMKGEVAALVVSLIRLKAANFVPRHDIIVALTADEEAAGHVNGIKWLLATHRPLIEAGLAFNPDGGSGGLRHGEHLFFSVETAEKTYATYTLTVTNKGGHSSQPEAENAIYRLSAGLLRLSGYRFPFRLTATTQRFLSVDAGLEPEPVRSDIRSVLATPPDAAAVERLSAHPNLNARIRTTCVATQLNAGAAENALPQRAQATVQCRLLPGDRPGAVRQSLQEVIADPQVDIALTRPVIDSPETVPDPHVIESITRIVDSFWPHLPVLVTMEAGGSDAIFTRAAGIPTYGVGSIFGDIDNNRHHGRDERIAKTSFDEGVEFTYRLMKQVDHELIGDR
jgi:acetylornithine deacetylase/succinyl-diaminopimelate desuccinylase-like protein